MPLVQTRTDELASSIFASSGAKMDSGEEKSSGEAGAEPRSGVVLDFANGIPGFPAAREFALEDLGADLEPFCRMRSLDDQGVSFLLVPPGIFFPDYSVEIDEEHVEKLGLGSADDTVVLAIVTLAKPPDSPTCNLLGPVVVNRRSLAAAQVVQHRSNYGVAVPITPPEPPSVHGASGGGPEESSD
jgi:flagellar assembly factor FliW